MLPVVSIVGRPNVGKSTIFNRLIGSRKAIVDDQYGVTRDRHYGESFWNGREFNVIDTGGYLPNETDVMIQGIREQIHIAIEESDLILFVVDTEAGITSLDQSVAQLLRQEEKPVLLVANKADNEERELNATEFYSLGFDQLYPISALSGRGTGDLLDEVVKLLPEEKNEPETSVPKLTVVGRPNVGKSSFINALLDDERCIVTDIPGTTRDSINSKLIYNEKEYILVDTAGLRKKAKVKENVEFYSTVRTDRALKECDVALIMLDAMRGFEEQDKRILRDAAKYNKGIVIVLNKWDLVPDKDTNVHKEFEEYVYSRVPMMKYIPIVSISAIHRKRIHKVIDVADKVLQERKKTIKTSELNDFIERILKEKSLPVRRGVKLKIKYGTQVKSNPPVFKFFMNKPEELPASYRRFIENRLRDEYQFTGVPITMRFVQK
ncbi:ribosome biogenesis GTPase Der [Fodinibius sp.]|uniref:ribosome biogenesis GTPase Der n=1 Tax=Fodinibius sp. TaxID=1872440 RepID=UPI002ACD7332|nr:ribosome biogenesis GTPase Der [Fodinibius sp.]MDZ7660221.1 ribosome biogenesis GTPase Der [Fodinibius sp.]